MCVKMRCARTRINNNGDDALNKYFDKICAKKIQLKYSNAEILDIRHAVTMMITLIATRIGIIDKRLKVTDKILVGSSAEGTQILKPNEHDFQLVIGEFSQANAISAKKEHRKKDCCVHIQPEDERLKKEWNRSMQQGRIMGTKGKRSAHGLIGLREAFQSALFTSMNSILGTKIKMSSGKVSIKTRLMEMHGPAFKIKLCWKSRKDKNMTINVDLCPVVRFKDLDSVYKTEDAIKQTFYDSVKSIGSVMLLPCPKKISCKFGLCFKVCFTLAEISLISNMSEHHKKCYRILKFLLNRSTSRPSTSFHSYCLKVLVLNHHYVQQCCEMQDCGKCVMKLLEVIESIFSSKTGVLLARKMHLSCPFSVKMNIWTHRHPIRDRNLGTRLKKTIDKLKVRSKNKPNISVNRNDFCAKVRRRLWCVIFGIICLLVCSLLFRILIDVGFLYLAGLPFKCTNTTKGAIPLHCLS